MATQCELILKDLKKGKKINPLQALEKYKCFRLASRINDLRADGHSIETKMVVNKNGKKQFAEYYLNKTRDWQMKKYTTKKVVVSKSPTKPKLKKQTVMIRRGISGNRRK